MRTRNLPTKSTDLKNCQQEIQTLKGLEATMHLFNKILLFGITKSNNVHEKSKNGLENPKIDPRYIYCSKTENANRKQIYQAAKETSNFFLLLR
jgi:cellulose biosynthesis protein BcsQ